MLRFLEFVELMEDGVATVNVGSGNIAGVGVGPQGEPGVNRKNKKKVIIAPILRRKANENVTNSVGGGGIYGLGGVYGEPGVKVKNGSKTTKPDDISNNEKREKDQYDKFFNKIFHPSKGS